MENKYIGLFNYYYSNVNYGAVLQDYALQEYLINLGFKVKTVNFRNFPRRPDRFLKCFIETYLLKNPFESFRRKHIKLTYPIFLSTFLNSKVLPFDTYVVGSDQMWRGDYDKNKANFPHTAYYLSFVDKKKKRISYAISFGVDYWCSDGNDIFRQKVISEVQKFDAISVREETGISICAKVFHVDASRTLDPTLLAGKKYFEKFVKRSTSSSYLAYYKLDVDEEFNSTLDVLKDLLGEWDLKNIYNNVAFHSSRVNGPRYNEVENWVSDIANAEYIITDSFHCVCFCILFEKEFICYPNPMRGISRLKDLLSMVGLEARLVFSSTNLKEKFPLLGTIDYLKVNFILEKERDFSKSFLVKNLDE